MNAAFKQQMLNATDRSQRSVFVGNISYEIPEDTIRMIFSKVGQVISIKMVHDRETGKPKGYGFIEYPDIATAELAIRNLNGYELSGRQLRVDSAAGGANSLEEINNIQISTPAQEESPYGNEVDPSKAPEAISRSVASLAPEKMFELMKQMKEVVHSNPDEVKSMLKSNPQLAYALLQAQVVMRIVDPQVAIAMLHRETPTQTKPFHQQGSAAPSDFKMQPPISTAPPVSAKAPQPPTIAPPFYHQGPPPHAAPFVQTSSIPLQPDITPEEQQNAELLMQVMQLSEEDLKMLPPGDREKIIELRQQLKRNVK